MSRLSHNPQNQFTALWIEPEPGEGSQPRLRILDDASRSILSRNESPDIPFEFSINPYRGCFHGCAYCYARPTHEFLEMSAGTDFERNIVVKRSAPALLREAFEDPSWRGDLVVFSGVTDCYQPLEARFQITRRCLEVCLEYRNPVGIITKSTLIERDVDLLVALHTQAQVDISISIPIFDPDKARALEPQVPTPARRLRALERLAAAGLPVAINVAPFVPGISEDGLRELLTAARDAGAYRANTIFLRLPGPVAEVFEHQVRTRLPLTAEKILSKVRAARGGRMNDPRFGSRMTGDGPYAVAALKTFESIARDVGLAGPQPEPRPLRKTFRRPSRSAPAKGQLDLFGSTSSPARPGRSAGRI
ncbi:MAG: PA0069 family radical SAM protein [Myxococcota bacterium]